VVTAQTQAYKQLTHPGHHSQRIQEDSLSVAKLICSMPRTEEPPSETSGYGLNNRLQSRFTEMPTELDPSEGDSAVRDLL